jgi:hypothetical protein
MFKTSKSKEYYQIAMSTDSREGFKPNSTQGEFWGGYMLDWMPYWILVVFGGFFGLDKLALRSPLTAFLKFIVNILFFGAWWVYDMLQLADTNFVAKYGHTTPFGVSGHGYRLIHNLTKEKTDEYTKASEYYTGIGSTFLFIVYVVLTSFMGFTGIPNIIYGDYIGGAIKLLTNLLVVTVPFYMIYQTIDIYRSSEVEKDGLSRPWPTVAGLFMLKDRYPATLLLPTGEATKQKDTYKKELMEMMKDEYQKDEKGDIVLDKLTKKPVVLQSGQRTGIEMAYDLFRAGARRFWPVYAASELAQEAQGTVSAVSSAAQKVATQNPEGLALAALSGAAPSLPEIDNPMIKKQGGGALIGISPEFDTILLMSMGVLIVGGFAAALLRKFSPPKREEDDEYPRNAYDRDDAPPNPGGV